MSALAPSISPSPTMVPASNQLTRNPMLPQHPLGAFTDSQYEADDAILRRNVAQQYSDLLQQLGYTDDNGQFIQGSVEAEANKQAANLTRQQDLAREQVTKDAQNQGTLFSGIRGTLQARAEDPYVRSRADLMAATPLSLQQLYERAAGLSGDYVLQQNQELAAAAARRAQGIIENPPAISGPAGDGGASSVATTEPTAGASLDPTGNSLTDAASIVRAPGADFGRTTYDPNTNVVSGQPILEHAPGIPVITLPKILQPGQRPVVGGGFVA